MEPNRTRCALLCEETVREPPETLHLLSLDLPCLLWENRVWKTTLDVSDMEVYGVFWSSVLFDIGHANATLRVLTDLLILCY